MKVFSNLAISIDGRIADNRDPKKRLGTNLDRKTMDVIRKKADVIVVGGNTIRVYPFAMVIPDKSKNKTLKQPANAIITASGEINPEARFWNDPRVVRFIFTSQKGYQRALENSRDRAFVVVAGEERVEIPAVLKRLKESNLKNVLVEGGGELISEFLKAKCLHEMYVTLTPWALGGRQNPSIVGGDGLLEWSALQLLKSKKVKDEIYLHYKVKGLKNV